MSLTDSSGVVSLRRTNPHLIPPEWKGNNCSNPFPGARFGQMPCFIRLYRQTRRRLTEADLSVEVEIRPVVRVQLQQYLSTYSRSSPGLRRYASYEGKCIYFLIAVNSLRTHCRCPDIGTKARV